MKVLRISNEVAKIFLLFLSWRILLIIILILSIRFVPLEHLDRFLGGGPTNYHLSQEVFAWANFDGEHYLSIAIFGYKGLEQAFFPFYPMLISFFAKPFSANLFSALLSSTLIGLLISNTALVLALIFLYELILLDFPKKISFTTVILLLIFPTSFYFGALYSESLFLLLSLLCFYFARKKRFFLASFFGFLSSATRIFGVLLLPAMLIEIYQQKEKFSKIFWIFFIPLGLGVYMLYQYLTVGDPLAFYHLQKIVGEQHQSGLTLLPQVYYRYIKMLIVVDSHSTIYQTIFLEFITGIVFFLLPIYGYFKKIRLSYLVYAMLGFLTPTIQGSFSSVPRYVIVFFPCFIALAIFWNNLSKKLKIVYLMLSLAGLSWATALFLRGYWIA